MADNSPPYVHFFGVMGATAAMVFSGKNDEVLIEFLHVPRHITLYRLIKDFFDFSSWSGVWNSQKWHRNSSHECNEARNDHEVHNSSCHGRYYRHLWFGGGSSYWNVK